MRKIIEKSHIADPALRTLIERLQQEKAESRINVPEGAAGNFVISMLFHVLKRNVVVICSSSGHAGNAYRDLCFFAGEEAVSLFPAWDILLTEDYWASQRGIALQRAAALFRAVRTKPSIFVVSLEALLQRVVSPHIYEAYLETFSIGDFRDRDALTAKLIEGGYKSVALVEEEGEFSVRGYIVDIFPPAAIRPYRLEFVGDEIETIREFNPFNQRSLQEVVDFVLPPAGELIFSDAAVRRARRNIRIWANDLGLAKAKKDLLFEAFENGTLYSVNPQFMAFFYDDFQKEEEKAPLGTILDYISRDSVLAFCEADLLPQQSEAIFNAVDRSVHKARQGENFYIDKEYCYLAFQEIQAKSRTFSAVSLEGVVSASENDSEVLQFPIERISGLRQEGLHLSREESLLTPLVENIRNWMGENYLITYVCSGDEEMQRMAHLLGGYSIPNSPSRSSFFDELAVKRPNGVVSLRKGSISNSFAYPQFGIVLVSEAEIFGRKIRRPARPRLREGYFLKSFGELQEGDYVVHVDHGIGRYQGLKKLKVGTIENDFLLLGYLGNDKLYIPVDRLDRIQRYIGPEGYLPPVDKLGGSSWEAVKERVQQSIREVAEELVAIYAAREVMDGHAFTPPERLYEEFSSAFEFEETPDQARAIEDVVHDMLISKPMDRLVCGDVGFGKTEVALRSAFIAVMEGRQVAVLVPTTILAEQHYQTFVKRFESYPVRIEALNRFRSQKQQKETIEGLRKGLVDIVIGTHRLLQKDVEFKNLGLVVIDEEQRFGVSHKEKLKKMRKLVDILTLTATPIPRTLQLSLVGIRDLSIIDTPPPERRSVNVYVAEFDETIIQDTIRRELRRSGQVFFVHDRVRSIYSMARLVEKLVPEASIGVAHGQMNVKELEEVMVRFLRREYSVLVCTTIIGAGIDIPSANTIVINRADRFGLSQLYQLRGRVGRSKEEAFACLLVPKGAVLAKDARKRLQAIQDFSGLGGGFKIAARDLELRGGGDLLGISQSGHVSAVGYELYTELMEKTIRELKGGKPLEEDVKPEIRLSLSAFIPDDYISDTQVRLVTYKKLSIAASAEELESVRDELYDCYGPLPPQLNNLMDIIALRLQLEKLKVSKMLYDGEYLVVTFRPDTPVEPAVIIRLTRKSGEDVAFSPAGELSLRASRLSESQIIAKAAWLTNYIGNSSLS